MKKINFVKVCFGIAIAFLFGAMISSCDLKEEDEKTGSENGGTNGGTNNETPADYDNYDTSKLPKLEVSIDGKIDHETYTEGDHGTVSFNRFPKTMAEFKEVREKIGTEPHGAVALQIMAVEIYRTVNKKLGEDCMRLNKAKAYQQNDLNKMLDKFGKSTVKQPYIMAAFLDGATPENGYNPTKPYTVKVRVSAGMKYVPYNDQQTTLLYLEVATSGYDGGWRGLGVFKTLNPKETSEGKYFIVNECSSLFLDVITPSFSSTFNGLD